MQRQIFQRKHYHTNAVVQTKWSFSKIITFGKLRKFCINISIFVRHYKFNYLENSVIENFSFSPNTSIQLNTPWIYFIDDLFYLVILKQIDHYPLGRAILSDYFKF